MKSRSKGLGHRGLGAALSPLQRQVLLMVAERLGPQLDCIDVESHRDGVALRQILLECVGKDEPGPNEVRVAVLDLIDRGWLALQLGHSVLNGYAKLDLTVRGLAAAREVQPGCGRPCAVVTLRMRRESLFAARLDTGNKELDRKLNAGGLTLAAFYVLGVLKPSESEPLWLANCQFPFARLALQGVGPKTGPGMRLAASTESIGGAVERLRALLPLHSVLDPADKRRTGWKLAGRFPEVRVEGASGAQFAEWTNLHLALGRLLRGEACLDRRGDRIEAHSDEDVSKLLGPDEVWAARRTEEGS